MAALGRPGPRYGGCSQLPIRTARMSASVPPQERRIVTKTSMGIRVAPADDFAGVLARVQGSLRRSEWSTFVAPWTPPPRSRLGALTGATRLSSRAGTHASEATGVAVADHATTGCCPLEIDRVLRRLACDRTLASRQEIDHLHCVGDVIDRGLHIVVHCAAFQCGGAVRAPLERDGKLPDRFMKTAFRSGLSFTLKRRPSS